MKKLGVLMLVLVMASCNGETPAGGGGDVNGGDDLGDVDFVFPDNVAADMAPENKAEDTALDMEPELEGPACAAGEGCFLDPCAENGDCQSGWCVEHMGEGVCTRSCTEECPDGWTCKAIAGTDPDLIYVCVSDHANLCKPCAVAADCVSPAGADDSCVGYFDGGSFCGGACDGDEDCPWGFSCVEAETVDGLAVTSCIADAGECPCTDKSVALALWTPCAVENAFGACAGKRVCEEDGLTDCDAAAPMEEVCNGDDDDCDDEIDEPALVEGDYFPLCDDGNPCTDDACLAEAGCEHVALDAGECVDGDACTVGDHCEAGVCVGLPVACDDGDPCTLDLCDGLGGCTTEPATGPCDDGDPCTVGDLCQDGDCVGTPVDCECLVDADCVALEDGDLCNGTLFCDDATLPYQCAVDPETVVSCPEPPEGPDAICLQAVCDSDNGECGLDPDHEGAACDDGDLCTLGDQCQEGACVSGAQMPCDDGNICTDDGCDSLAGCVFVPNDEACDDGNPCTTGDQCQDGLCGGTGLEDCDDGNPCTDDVCDLDAGCVHTLNTAPCDDGDLCTTGDHCHLGACMGVGALPCDDGNPCTDDACDPLVGCQFTPNDAPCDDGNACTSEDHCAGGWCVPSAMVDCDDWNPCTDDACTPFGGCQNTANALPCDDGDACTTADQCSGGACQGGPAPVCDDENPCTDDTCAPATGCEYTPNAAACDDGDACTTADQCSGGACQGGPAPVCDDENPCTDDTCAPATGCEYTPNAAACDDGDACTTADQCSGGACQGGPALVCDDSNPCTSDTCAPTSGCVFTPVDNGTACPGGTCLGGICQPTTTGKLVFVSSQKHTGNFGGVTGADSFCQGLASAAGHSGTFKAWLSAGSYGTSPAARFAKSSQQYVLVDGSVIANNWTDLTDGSIQHAINLDENGAAASYSMVYSFTRIDGTHGLFGSQSEDCYGGDCHCNGWTITATQGSPTPGSAVGRTGFTDDDWTDYSFGNFCGGNFPIYCFQQQGTSARSRLTSQTPKVTTCLHIRSRLVRRAPSGRSSMSASVPRRLWPPSRQATAKESGSESGAAGRGSMMSMRPSGRSTENSDASAARLSSSSM